MGNGKVTEMQKQNVSARDLLADILLAHREDSTMQYLYVCMYGKPMPSASNPGSADGAGNILPFPKRLSLGHRRKILRDAMQQLESGSGNGES
jgi:hypothetical protein